MYVYVCLCSTTYMHSCESSMAISIIFPGSHGSFFTQEPPGTSEKGPGEHAAGSRLPAGSPALPSDAFALVEVSRDRPSFEQTS